MEPAENGDGPRGAKLVGGVWLPETETHIAEWMQNSKRGREVDGKLTYQYHKIERALALNERRDTYVDIGAHVGLWAMWLAPLFRRTVAFEPVRLHAEIFPYNVTAPNVELQVCALGDRAGTVDMEVAADETGSFHVHDPRRAADDHDRRDGRGEVLIEHGVPMRTLDSFGLEGVDLIKIDVEGWELPVVEGARETLLRCRPAVVVEQKGHEKRGYGHPRRGAVSYLRKLGMREVDCLKGDYMMAW